MANDLSAEPEAKPVTRPQHSRDADSERKSKLKLALLSLAGVLATAAISGVVSWYVSAKTLELQGTVQRATLFKDLLTSLDDEKTSGYAVLALWKLYPEDRKLIVISALQSDSSRALSALLMLGLTDELKDYESTVLSAINNADSTHKRNLWQLYARLNPEGLLNLTVDEIIGDPRETFAASRSFEQLTDLLSNNHSIQQKLKEIIKTDKRVAANSVAEFTLAMALYRNSDFDAFDDLLTRAAHNIQLFGNLANLIQGARLVVNYRISDQEKLLDLSIRSMEVQSQRGDRLGQFFNAVRTFEQSYDPITLSSSNRARVIGLFEGQFKAFPGDRPTREIMLRIAAAIQPDSAKIWYSSAVSCEDERGSKIFYYASTGRKLLWNQDDLGISVRLELRQRFTCELITRAVRSGGREDCRDPFAFCMVGSWPFISAAQSLNARNLQCTDPLGDVVDVQEMGSGQPDAAYRANLGKRVIEFSPYLKERRPEAVSKLEFAIACLEVTRQSNAMCDGIRFLQRSGALNRSDIQQLEMYYSSKETPES